MNREEYIKIRTDGSPEIMYEYYKEHFNKEKHKDFLKFEQFVEFIQLYPLIQQAYNVSCAYYDARFNVLHIPLTNKTLYI